MPYLKAIAILKIPCKPIAPKFWEEDSPPRHFGGGPEKNTVKQGFSDIAPPKFRRRIFWAASIRHLM